MTEINESAIAAHLGYSNPNSTVHQKLLEINNEIKFGRIDKSELMTKIKEKYGHHLHERIQDLLFGSGDIAMRVSKVTSDQLTTDQVIRALTVK